MNDNNLFKIRHSCQHIFQQALSELGYKTHQAIGPAIDEGFYADFELLKGEISEQDFEKIEKKMQEIINRNLDMKEKQVSVKEAKEYFRENPYKIELIEELDKKGEKITFWVTGSEDQFVDLCKGPHTKNTSDIKAFKLLSIAGAYWRGDEKNKMLTRIYGTAFKSKKELDKYLELLEEAKKRDHRKLGKELDLFHFSEKVGQGLPLWTPKGSVIREELEKWAKETEKEWGYVRVNTPHIGKEDLYITSGHLPYYRDDMYPAMNIEGEEYFLKGMNCPHHFEIFNRKQHSYKDLPKRYAEYGTVYRYELSGSLFGLMRVRSIAQNDAHIFCTEDQAEKEFLDVIKLHEYYYNTLGLTRDNYHIVIGLPDPKKSGKYHGDKKIWEKAEKMMRNAIEKSGIRTIDDIGGAAFYGPKIDFNVTSSIGREFSISTNQLDLFMPQRFNLEYTDKDGSKKLVAVIHRAPLGSHERFIGFLIEHFAGAFPVWISPVQVQIIPVSEKSIKYAKNIAKELDKNNIRYELDAANETMGNKIRKAQKQKVPLMVVVGEKEANKQKISIRDREGNQKNMIELTSFIKSINKLINSKSLELTI